MTCRENGRLVAKAYLDEFEEEAQRKEIIITNEDDVFDSLQSGHNTGEVARASIVCRELGMMEEDILQSNEMLMYHGARQNVHSIIKSRKDTMTMPNGKEYDVRQYIAVANHRPTEVDVEEGGVQYSFDVDCVLPDAGTMIKSNTKAATLSAWNNLRNWAPGYIFNQLKIIAGNGGDVEEACGMLKDVINNFERRLLEGEFEED
jgi:hypothetical protein